MGAQRLASWGAGLLWLLIGLAMVLTIFGPVIGFALFWLIAVRRSVSAARVGTFLGVLLLLAGQLVLDVSGCRRGDCGIEPYLVGYGLPLVVIALNLRAGWSHLRRQGGIGGTGIGGPGSGAS